MIESSYRYLAAHNKVLQERLNEYETVEALIVENRLEDTIGMVNRRI